MKNFWLNLRSWLRKPTHLENLQAETASDWKAAFTPPPAARTALSRADLLYALVHGGESQCQFLAESLGYLEFPPEPQTTPLPAITPPSIAPASSSTLVAPSLPLAFWAPIQVTSVPEPPPELAYGATIVETLVAHEIGVDPLAPPPPKAPPLSPWSTLWSRLDPALRRHALTPRIAVAAVVRAWSRVRVLSRLPRLERQRQALPLIVLVDRSDCLTPFFDDQEECLEALRRVYGDGGVKIVWLPEGPSSNIEVDFEHDRISLSRGATVLALSDLGHYAGAQTRERWRACGERLRTCECQLVALMPVPRSRWRSDLTNLWPALAWENASSTLSSARPTSQELEERASQLIDRVDWACGIDFGLLREVRRLLPSDQADVGTEADAYTHARVRGNGHRVFYVDRRSAPALIPADESQAIVEIVRKWHRHRELTREVWFEDLLAKFGEAPADLDDIEALQTYAKRIAATLKSEGRERERLKPWVEGLKGKISEGAWRDTRLGAALMEAFAQLEGGAKARPNRPIQAWKLYQRGGEIVVWSPENPPESLAGLSLIGEIRSQAGWVEIDEGRRIDLETFSPLAQELGESSRIALQTDRQRVVLELLTRPEWANAGMGRDRYGLWAAFSVSGVMQRMRYIAPGRFWMGSPENEVGRYEDEGPRHEVELTRGYWLADTPCTQALWQAVMGDNPSHFQSPTRPVETITAEDTQQFCQRLNGRSSGSEVFRLPTEAEWEYACRAGTEASTYAGELEILGEHKAPLLNKIAWYGGNSGVDFDLREGVDSSQWPEKEFEHSRAGTRIVAQKLPNAWGLFDMLGNVWERCEDRFESYASERSVDPLGQKGGYRVIRGGSWNVSARRVRAAYRYEWRVGDSRYDLLGFRLARGQALAAPQASEAEPRAEELETVDEARRGTSRRRPPSRARSSAKQKRSKK